MAVFKQRTSEPSKNDINYIRYDKKNKDGVKGTNYCIALNQSTGYVLPNCTGYAWGRWREILGKFHNLSRGNAEVWWGKGDGYKRGQTPKVGAVVCWRQGAAGSGADGMGHVAIVEQVNADGSIVTSNSAYKDYNRMFYRQTLKPPYIYAPGFVLQGFIYLPGDWTPNKPTPPKPKPEPKPDPKPTPTPDGKATIKSGAKYVSKNAAANGKPVGSSYIGKPLDFELNRVKDKPSWVYFQSIKSYVDKKDVNLPTEKPKPEPKPEVKPQPKPTPTQEGKATIKSGAKYVSKSASVNGKPVGSSYIGKPLDFKLNRVKDKPNWVYFPSIKSYVDKKDVILPTEKPKPTPTPPPVQKLNEYGQAVFAGSNIEFSYVYNKANNGTSKPPYFKNSKGRGYGKVVEVIHNAQAPYKVERNGSIVGFVKPVNTY